MTVVSSGSVAIEHLTRTKTYILNFFSPKSTLNYNGVEINYHVEIKTNTQYFSDEEKTHKNSCKKKKKDLIFKMM